MRMRRVFVSARVIMFLSQVCKSDLRSDTDIERKGELFLYYFPMHLRKNDLNICCGILRTQKPKTQCKPHRQMGRKQCLPKREEAGITLSSFLTLKSSNVITGKILKDELVPCSHFTHEKSKTQERFDVLQQLTNMVRDPGLLTYSQMPSSQTTLSFLPFLCNHLENSNFALSHKRCFVYLDCQQASQLIALD